MKKINTITILFILFNLGLNAQTTIPDSSEVFGTWSKANSPYLINGEVIIPSGKILNIEPGVTIYLKEGGGNNYHYRTGGQITIKGRIEAIGTRDEKIQFTCQEPKGIWNNITIDYSINDTSIFKYCDIERASGGRKNDDRPGAICNFVSNVKIINCNIHDNPTYGIYASLNYDRLCNTEIKNTIIHHNEYGICNSGYRRDRNKLTIINSTIVKNNNGSVFNPWKLSNSILMGGDSWDISIQKPYECKDSISIENNFIDNLPDSFPLDHMVIFINNITGFYPQFVDTAGGDFHLKPTSLCIDVGNPDSDFSNEPLPNGGRINLGAYGNTDEATSYQNIIRVDSISNTKLNMVGYDRLSFSGINFGATKANGSIKIGDVEVMKYLYWTNDSISILTTPLSPQCYDIILTNNNGETDVLKNAVCYKQPEILELSQMTSPTSGNKEIKLIGVNFGEQKNSTKILFNQNEALSYTFWSDTLIVLNSPPNPAGEAIIKIESDNSAEYQFPNYFLYTDKNVTELCGEVGGTWESGQVYILKCNVSIPEDSTLIIEDGVQIMAVAGRNISLKFYSGSELITKGTSFNPIIFCSTIEVPGSWEGVFLHETHSACNLNYCEIKNATTALTLSGLACGCSSNDNYAEINNCIIHNNVESGIYCRASGCSSWGCTIRQSAWCNPIIKNCKIFDNGDTGIKLDSNSGSGAGARVAPTIYNCLIFQNKNGLYSYGDGTVQPKILNNVIAKNSENGLKSTHHYFSSTDYKIANNIFSDNNVAISNSDTAKIHLNNNAFYNNGSDLLGEFKPNTNIFENPFFVDVNNNDFNLQSTSSCIDVGSNEFVDFDKDFEGKVRIWDGNNDQTSIVDIGAFEFGAPCNVTQLDTLICFGENFNNWSTSGQYQLTLANQNNCDSIILVNLTVDEPVDVPTFTQNGDLLTTSTSGNIQWYLNGGPIPGASNKDYTFGKSGEYQVEITNENGCSAISSGIWCVKTGIDDFENSSFLLYPNPTTNKFYVRLKQNLKNAELKVFTTTGQLIYTQSINGLKENDIEVSTNNWTKGIYHIQISTKKNILEGKIVIN